MDIGLINELVVKEVSPSGLLLSDSKDQLVLLSSKEVQKTYKPGDNINVFVYVDAENELVATLQKPNLMLYQFGVLKVKQTNPAGAFLDWGISKDLFLPYPEQDIKVKRGENVFVFVTLDPTNDKLFASSKIDPFLPISSSPELSRKQKVDLIIWKETDLGFKVVINSEYQGLIYHDEVYQPLEPGQRLTGYIKLIREDGKIDVSLQPIGAYAIDANSKKILDEIKKSGGYLELHDKSSPEEIEAILHMSKKAFKRALGNLYKLKLISIEKEGVRTVG